jgi:4-carboxymuconolactone decarboxylase
LAIITVGAHWAAEFEWWAHTKNARHAGISEKTIEAIRRGETPSLDDDVSRAVHGVAHQLATTGHVDDATYKLAEDSLGPARLVELVALCGYYSLISFILNTFDVPLPEGVEPSFGPE